MATGRIIKTAISVSEQVNDMSLAAALLFTWMIPHADDFGRMAGSARKIKALVVPMRNDLTPEKVDKCLEEMEKAGLLIRYSVKGETYIQLPKWDEHQSGLHKRTRSKSPDPEGSENGDSGKFREIPSEQNRTEQKGTENIKPEFDLFWSSASDEYKRVGSEIGTKAEAKKVWDKLSPDEAQAEIMLQALQRQSAGKTALRDAGEFAPAFKHLCRWIKNESWENDVIEADEGDDGEAWKRAAL